MTVLRSVAFLVGFILLAATAHVTISATGGYTQPHAILTMAIALGVGIAALAIGAAWSHGRLGLAWWLVAAILAGEGFGFLMTAERLVTSREAAQAPLREAERARDKALQRVADAESTRNSLPATSPRLDDALTAKATADAAVIDKSAERGCAANCRALLQAQVDSAQAEVEGAREEIVRIRQRVADELIDARAALDALKPPASPTPLADRLGLPAWALDLVAAALGSMAANGLGCGLLAFAAHHEREQVASASAGSREPTSPCKTVVRHAEHAAQFAVEALAPAKSGGVDLLTIHDAYRSWCNSKNVEPLSADMIGAALAELFDGTGITVAERAGRRVALGVAIKDHKRRALGRMVTVGSA